MPEHTAPKTCLESKGLIQEGGRSPNPTSITLGACEDQNRICYILDTSAERSLTLSLKEINECSGIMVGLLNAEFRGQMMMMMMMM